MTPVLLIIVIGSASFRAQTVPTNSTQGRPEIVLQAGHTKSIDSVAFSPDNQVLASGSVDNTVRLWDVATGRELRSLTGHTGSIKAVTFSPDGQWLASGSNDSTIKLWRVATGREEHSLTGHSGPVESLAFSPDNRWLASGSVDKTIMIWDVATGDKLHTLPGHAGWVTTVAFSRDGNWLASGGSDTLTKLWSVAGWKEVRTLKGHTGKVTSVAFSPDSQWLASGDVDATVKLWKVSKATKHEKFNLSHTGKVLSVAFTADGRLFSGSNDRVVKLWDVATGTATRTIADHSNADSVEVESVAFSTDGQLIASGSGDKTIELRDTAKGDKIRSLDSHGSGFYAVSFSPDGRWLASGSYDNTVKLWDIATGSQLPPLAGHTGYVTTVAFSQDGRWLASGSVDKTVRIWDVAIGSKPRILKGHTDTVNAVAISPDGRWLASGSVDQTIKLWDMATGREARTLTGHSGEVTAVAFSPDSRWLASGGVDQRVNLWDLMSGAEKPRTLASRPSKIRALAYSPNGQWLALASADKTITLLEPTTGNEVRSLIGHSGEINSLAFTSDGQRLASGSNDKKVKFWDVATGREIQTLSGHSGGINALSFSPKDQWLASASEDGSTLIWDPKAYNLVATLMSLRESADWLVVTPDGLFDGSPTAWNQILWRFAQNTFNVAPVEAFFNEFYYPGLLTDILAGKKPKAVQDISQKDRRQPKLELTLENGHESSAGEVSSTRTVRVKINVTEAPAGAQDVRLFRNGSLVRTWRGDVLKGQGSMTLNATIPIVAGENQLTAYAFNRDNIKSEDKTLMVNGGDNLKRAGTAYILAIGVNEYANPEFNLKYAVPDAQDFGAEVERQQKGLGRFGSTEVIRLLDKDATKANILYVLKRLAGTEADATPAGGMPEDLQKLKRADPEDAVIIYFAGHGTAEGKRFYLIPHDLGYAGKRTKAEVTAHLPTILEHSVSDEELEQAFELVDAGQLLLVIDACNSGQALEAEEKRRGPMNSKGLAQLAYEKGMYILTAAQSNQEARGAGELEHGYLTYALVEEGLKEGKADNEPKDGQILVREWLDYATTRVPQMQGERSEQEKRLLQQEEGTQSGEAQHPRVFYRRELEVQPLIVAKSH